MSRILIADRQRQQQVLRSVHVRRRWNHAFHCLCILVTALSVLVLAILLLAILFQGLRHLNWQFLSSPPSPQPQKAGIMPAMFGTIWLCAVCAAVSLPLGVATAIFLEEFPPRGRAWKRLHGLVQLNISNLAGVPSVVYGILGLTVFVQMFGVFGSPKDPALEWGVRYYDQFLSEGDEVLLVPAPRLAAEVSPVTPRMVAWTPTGQQVQVHVIGPQDPWPSDEQLRRRTLRLDAEAGRISQRSWYYMRLPPGRGVLAGGLTLMLVVLPILIIASQEALRAVPSSLRDGSLGMGATRWQTVWQVTLPAAVPQIMTGSILAMSRAVGEAAPLLMIAGIVFIANPPAHLVDDFTAMPLQIFNWAQRPQRAFHELAASGIIVLLAVLLLFNALAIFIRFKTQKPLS